MIKVEDITFAYKKSSRTVLKELSFNIEKGSITILLGLNGSGKTTLIKLLVGLIKPIKGKIIVNNNDLKSLSYKDRSLILSYVSQKSNLIDDVLISDYLLLGMVNKLLFYEKPKEEHINRMYDLCRTFRIEHLLNKTLGEVSGGERQIISICSAILQDTDIIILDEPTSALDLKNQNLVLRTLERISKESKRTIILSTHNPNHGLRLNSDVLLIDEGNIMLQGKSKDIITVENLKKVYGNEITNSKDLDYNEITFVKS